jgi:hypothetical protein
MSYTVNSNFESVGSSFEGGSSLHPSGRSTENVDGQLPLATSGVIR